MEQDWSDDAEKLCRQAQQRIDGHGSYRLRVLMQMVLAELEKEQKAQGRRSDDERPGDPST